MNPNSTPLKLLFSVFLLFLFVGSYTADAQTQTFASTVDDRLSVTDQANAVDEDLATYAELTAEAPTLFIGGVDAYIELGFDTTIPSGTTTYIKMETEAGLLDVLLGGSLGDLLGDVLGVVLLGQQEFTIQAFDSLGNEVYEVQSQDFEAFGNDLANVVVDADGNYYVAITPTSDYENIRITNSLNSTLLGLGNTAWLRVYDAFYGTGGVDCGKPSFTNYDGDGISLDLINIAGAGVDNPEFFIDNSNTTFSELNLGVLDVLASIEQRTFYQDLVDATNDFKIRLGVDPSLIALGVLNNIQIVGYNGSTEVFSTDLNSLINLDLLGLLESGTVVDVPVSISVAVDGVSVRYTSLLNTSLSQSLQLYNIAVTPDIPVLDAATENIEVCEDDTADLVATSTTAGAVLNWYDSLTATTPLATVNSGETFTTSALSSDTTFYVASSVAGCVEESARVAVDVAVNARPTASDIVFADVNLAVCIGQDIIIQPTTLLNGDFQFYLDAGATQLIEDGDVIDGLTYTINADGDLEVLGLTPEDSPVEVFVSVTDQDTGCSNAPGDLASINLSVDVGPDPQLFLAQDITADDVINIAESSSMIPISGSVGGDAVAGDEVEITVNSNLYTAVVQGDLTFSVDVAGSDLVADPDLTVDASLTISGGLLLCDATTTATATYTLDLTAPTIPTVDFLTTNNQTPTLTGTLDSADDLTVTVDGVTYTEGDGDLLDNGDGTWTLTIPTGNEISEGIYDVLAEATDASGNTSTDATTDELTIDLTDPTIPSVNSQVTANTLPTITGTADSIDDLRVSVNGVTYTEGDGDLVDNGNDTWTLMIPTGNEIGEGVYDVVAEATDAAGNSTNDVTTDELTVDFSVPTNPTVDFLTTTDTTPLITGTLDSADDLSVTVNGVTYNEGDGDLQDNNDGTWQLQIPPGNVLAEGVYDVSAVATDTALNTSSDTTINELTIDLTAPTTPTVDLLTTNDQTPTITGTADSVDDLTVTVNGVTYTEGDGNLIDNTDDTWTLNIPTGNEIGEGVYDVVAEATDAAGNTATDTTTDELTIDLTAPTTPTVDLLTTNDQTPTITGTADSVDDLTVTVNGVTYTEGDGNLIDNTDDTWTLNIPTGNEIGEGVYDVVAEATDAAGNTATDTTTDELTIDLTAPTTPTVDLLTTNDQTPTITGTADSVDNLIVTVNGVTYTEGDGNLIDNTNDTWTLNIPTGNEIGEGVYDVVAEATDTAGNTATDATTDELTIDLTASTTPSVNLLTTNDQTPTITGTADSVDDLTVTVNGVTYTEGDGNLIDNTDDTWTLNIPTGNELGEGVYDVVAEATDAAGNTATDLTTDELTIDLTAPTIPSVDLLTTNDQTPTITGTADSVDDLTVTVNGVTYTEGDGNLIDNTDDTWTLNIPTGNELGEGVYDVVAEATDAAGNTATDTTTDELTIDLTASTTPTVDLLTTNDQTPTITGTADSVDDLTVTVNGVTYAEGDGNLIDNTDDTWTLNIPTGNELGEGVYDILAEAQDGLGNSSTDTTTDELTIDLTAPTTPTVDALTTTDTTPTITGTADSVDDLTVTVNGITYTEGDGNLTDNTDDTWTLVIPPADALVDGVYDVLAEATDGVGNTATDTTTDELTISPATPNGDANQEFCESDNPVVDDIVTDQPNVNVYLTTTGGTALSPTDPLTNNTPYYIATVGTNIESVDRLEVLVTFTNAPAPTTLNATQDFCVLNNPTVADIQVNEAGVIWYAEATGGTALATDTALEDGETYYASLTTNGCESATRLEVTTNVFDQPTITFDSSASVSVALNQTVTLPGVTTTPAGLPVTWYDNTGAVFTGSTVSFATPGVYVFTATAESSTGCSNSAFFSIAVYDQDDCPPANERTYASSSNFTSLGGFITSSGSGSDGNPKTAATITTVVGLAGLGGGYYDLSFGNTFTAGTQVNVKMGKEYSGLGTLSSFIVYGLDGSGNPIGSGNTADSGIVNLLSADGSFEFTFVPNDNTGPKSFTGVRIYFGSLLSVADSYKVFDAYVTSQSTTLSCTAIDAVTKADVQDVNYGVEALATLDALSATASVVNPWSAVDKDLTTFTTLSRGAEVLNTALLDIEFKSQSQPTDSLQIIYSRPDNGLLQLGLLNGLEIQLYNGDAEVGAPITNNTSGLNLQLLGLLGGAGESAAITVPTPNAYDRVVISYGGVANVLDAIQISDVDRKAAVVPTIPLNTDDQLELCSAGETIMLVSQDDCTWFEVYDESGNQLTTTDNYEFELPAGLTEGQAYTFTVQPVRQGCDFGYPQDLEIYIKESTPDTAITSFTLNGGSDAFTCESGADVTLSVTTDAGLTLTNPVYYWYEDQSGTQVLVTGETDATLNLGPLTAGTYTYYVGISSDEYCKTNEADRFEITFTINPAGMPGDVTVTGDAICFGDTATVMPTSTYANVDFAWYFSNDTSTPITNGTTVGGKTYTLDASGNLTIDGLQLADDGITYFVSISGGDSSVCENTAGNLTPVSVSVFSGAVDPTTNNATQEFCVVDAPTVSQIQVNESNVVWYDASTGGTAFSPTDLLESRIYYGAQVVGSCESANRVAVTVDLQDTAAPTTTDPSQEFCVLDNATLADIQVNGTGIVWYDAATGGNLLADSTLIQDGGVYFAAQAGTGCESSTRLEITTILNDQPVITFSGPSSVNVALNASVTLPGVTTTPSGLPVTWFDNQGNVFTGSSVSFATPGVYVFTASAENSNGCSNSAFFTITVFDQDDCPPAMQRIYATSANFTSLGGFATNEANGADGNPKTSATITTIAGIAGLGGGYYDLTFDDQYPAGTPVSVKMGKEYSGLGTLSGFLVYGLDGSGNPIGAGNSVDAGVINLLSADAAFEFTFVPNNASGPQAYSGVRVYFGSLLSLGDSYNVYDAYVNEQVTTLNCTGIDSTVKADVQDVFFGVETIAGLDALSATASVVDPWFSVDFDDFTYTTLSRGVEVANSAQLRVDFKTLSQPTDSLRIVISRPDNDILQLGLLNGLEIQLYNGDAEVGAPITNTTTGLNLQLLTLLGGTGGENVLTVPTTEPFDNVLISYGGVANVLDAIRIHDVDRKAAVETVIPLNVDGALELCYDDTISLVQQDDCTFYQIYDEGNNPLTNVDTYEFDLPDNLVEGQTYTFTVQPIRQGCEFGPRQELEIYIRPTTPASVIVSININGDTEDTFCETDNTSISLTAETDGTTLTNPTYYWYQLVSGNQEYVNGETDATLDFGILPPGTYTYYVGVESDEFCLTKIADRTSVTFTIQQGATEDDIADILVNGVNPADPLCLLPIDEVILSTMLSATSTITNEVFAWYDAAGNPVAGGTDGNLNLGILAPGTYTYSVGVSGDGFCENLAADRKTVTFTINEIATQSDIADITVNGLDPSSPLCIDPSDDVVLMAMLSATSTFTNEVFAWYDAAGNSVTGGTDGNLNLGTLAPGTYTYSVGVSGDGFCENLASDRKTVTFTINDTSTETDIADITVNGLDPSSPLCIDPSDDVVLMAMRSATSTITNEVFAWYDAAGNPVAGGTDGNLNLGILAPGTYTYSVGVSGDGFCENLASDRKTVTFTINDTATEADIADITVNGFDPSSPLCIDPSDDVVLMSMLSATSTITNEVFAWYDSAGNPVAGGTDGNLNLGILAPGTYTYSVGVSGDGFCENLASDRKTVTFTINDTTTEADIADITVNGFDPSSPLCIDPSDDVVLMAMLFATSTITNEVFAWYDAAGNPVAGGTDGNLNLGILAPGTYIYSVGVSGDGFCENLASDRKTVTFTINDTSTEADIADITVNGFDPSSPLCIDPSDDVVLMAMLSATSTITNEVFAWYDAAGNPVAGGTDGNLNLGTLAPGTYTYSVGVSGDGFCENLASDRKTVTFTINDTATEADIADITVNGFDPSSPLCIDPSDDVVLMAMLSATSTITNEVFAWYDAAGNPVAGGIDGNLNLGILAPGTYTYSVGVSGDGFCENLASDRKTVTFTINHNPVEADITVVDTMVCFPNDVVVIPSTTIANATFNWYATNDYSSPINDGDSDGTVTFAIATNGTLTISGLEAGVEYTYYVSVTNEDTGCMNAEGDFADVKVSADAGPDVQITLDQDITADDVINIEESNGTVPITGVVGGDVQPGAEVEITVNGVLYTAIVQANLTFSVEVDGADLIADADLTIDASVTIAGDAPLSCEKTASDTATYTVDVTAPAIPTVDFLTTSDTTPTLTGTAESDDFLTVTVNGVTYSEGDGNLFDNGDDTWTLNIPDEDEMEDGTYDVVASATDDAGNTSVDVTLDELTITVGAPNGDMEQQFCASDLPTIDDIVTDQFNVNVYLTETGGSPLPSGTLLIDDTNYYVATVGVNSESVDRLEVHVTLISVPGPTASETVQEFCITDNPTVSDLVVNEPNVVWYSTQSGGTVLADNTPLENNTVYYGAIQLDGCESKNRIAITAIVKENNMATLSQSTPNACFGTEITYTTESGMQDYAWTYTGAQVIDGGGATDNFITLIWDMNGANSISVMYTDVANCDPEQEAMLDVDVIVCTDLTIVKTVDDLNPVLGENITYTITVTSEGVSPLSDIVVDESLPNGVSYVSHTADVGDYNEILGTWLIPNLAPGATATLQITATVVEGSDYVNTAYITTSSPPDSDPDNNESSVEIEPDCLWVFNEFSPNGDGKNDTFFIRCIERYPDNHLEIYNRDGSLVFETDGYNNDWGGNSNQAGFAGSGIIPAGTYYYTLDLRDGSEVLTGWVYIAR